MSVKQNLIAAKALIDTPEKWTQDGDYEAYGCLCAIGALAYATGRSFAAVENGSDEHKALLAALPDGWNADMFGAIPEFNDDDTTTHADIMALFDRAIEACND